MENEDVVKWAGVAIVIATVSAVVGWHTCSLSGGYFADNLASAGRFAVIGGGIGFWLGWYFMTSATPPLLVVAGTAIAVYW